MNTANNVSSTARHEHTFGQDRHKPGERRTLVVVVLQDRLVEVFKQYANARQQVDQYRTEILPNAKSSLDLTQKGYQAGEFGYLELLTAQRTYFRVNLGYLQSLRGLWVNAVEIEGLLLTGGLTRPGS